MITGFFILVLIMCFFSVSKTDKERIKELSIIYNRSEGQEYFLLNLCCNDFKKLIELEDAVKNKFIYSCPNDTCEIYYITNKI